MLYRRYSLHAVSLTIVLLVLFVHTSHVWGMPASPAAVPAAEQTATVGKTSISATETVSTMLPTGTSIITETAIVTSREATITAEPGSTIEPTATSPIVPATSEPTATQPTSISIPTPTPALTPMLTNTPAPAAPRVTLVDFDRQRNVIWDRMAPAKHQVLKDFKDACDETNEVEWRDCKADDTTDKIWPVAYTRNEIIKLKTITLYAAVNIPAGEVTITGKTTNLGLPCGELAEGTITFAATVKHPGGDTVTASEIKTTGTLPNCVTSYINADRLTISWTIDYTDQATQKQTIKDLLSTHTIYVLYDTPTKPEIYLTILDVSTARARKQSEEAKVVAAIWEAFQGPQSKPTYAIQRRTLEPKGGKISLEEKGQLQFYQHPWTLKAFVGGTYTYPEAWTTDELLDTRYGLCFTWARFFIDTLGTHGIKAKMHYIRTPQAPKPIIPLPDIAKTEDLTLAPASAGFMLIKTWTFQNPTGVEPYFYKLKATQNLAIDPKSEVNYAEKDQHPGQNNVNPPPLFPDHALVVYKGHYYDPSYGGKSYATLAEWEQASISGYTDTRLEGACKLQFPNGKPAFCGK
jgi:hypothetical protein